MKKPRHIRRPDWWTAIFTGILAVTTVGVVWYARQQIKAAREVVQTELRDRDEADRIQHLLTLVAEFDQEPMATYRKRLAQKRLNAKPGDDPYEAYRVLDFFDTVGRLMDRGYLADEDVWDQFGYWVLHLNADPEIKSDVDYEQKNNPNEYASYLKMVATLQLIDAEHGGYLSHISITDVRAFYMEEAQIAASTSPRGSAIPANELYPPALKAPPVVDAAT